MAAVSVHTKHSSHLLQPGVFGELRQLLWVYKDVIGYQRDFEVMPEGFELYQHHTAAMSEMQNIIRVKRDAGHIMDVIRAEQRNALLQLSRAWPCVTFQSRSPRKTRWTCLLKDSGQTKGVCTYSYSRRHSW